MKQIKVSEATSIQLDWLVAKCKGIIATRCGAGPSAYLAYTPKRSAYKRWEPTRNWKQGGALIERERITLDLYESGEWLAQIWGDDITDSDFEECGPTPLIAAMRCYVSSRMGDEVEVPEELL